MSDSVVVVGGGLAGIAAALRLADRGAQVTLLEARSHLGGATYSLLRDGLLADTGQHVFLRCYHAYRALLERLGVSRHAPVQDHFAIPVLHARGLSWLYRAGRAPAPLHLTRSLLGYSPLSPRERISAGRAVLALRDVDPADPHSDALTFGSWLRRRHQSARSIDRLWGLIAVAALNLPPDKASLAIAAQVFRTAFLGERDAADIGVPTVPLRHLHAEPASRLFARLGVAVHTGSKVMAIEPNDDGFVLRTRDGTLSADAVVVAVPHPAAARLVPPQAVPDRERWTRLGSAPIVNVHLRYNRKVLGFRYAAALDSPVQWIFDRTRAAGLERGQYLVVSVSAAHGCIDAPAEEVRRTYSEAVDELLPGARIARLEDSFVTREPHATFHQGPGTAELRPPARTLLPNLALAGAWTATGWPDTMEGAVRSGLQAADVLDISRARPPRLRTFGEALP